MTPIEACSSPDALKLTIRGGDHRKLMLDLAHADAGGGGPGATPFVALRQRAQSANDVPALLEIGISEARASLALREYDAAEEALGRSLLLAEQIDAQTARVRVVALFARVRCSRGRDPRDISGSRMPPWLASIRSQVASRSTVSSRRVPSARHEAPTSRKRSPRTRHSSLAFVNARAPNSVCSRRRAVCSEAGIAAQGERRGRPRGSRGHPRHRDLVSRRPNGRGSGCCVGCGRRAHERRASKRRSCCSVARPSCSPEPLATTSSRHRRCLRSRCSTRCAAMAGRHDERTVSARAPGYARPDALSSRRSAPRPSPIVATRACTSTRSMRRSRSSRKAIELGTKHELVEVVAVAQLALGRPGS